MRKMRQKIQMELAFTEQERGDAPKLSGKGIENLKASNESESQVSSERLMEEICHPENLGQALYKVRSNKGAPGIDGMSVKELPGHLKKQWPILEDQLLRGDYRPQPVKRVEIPKPEGGRRKLGIPTVVDRLIQQAVLQVLQREIDRTFSENSYGFRPRRSAHQAIGRAQAHIRAGYSYVVDIDLEKFFDRVNHDRLMGRLAKWIQDKRVLKLIRAYLNAGMMENGLVSPTKEGTPQGGPLSPLLSNIVLDELDWELERRRHCFVRYADDCNVYVRSERAGHRVMAGVERFLTQRLKLKINKAKSAVGRPWERKFLGFSFTNDPEPRRRIAPQALKRFKKRVQELTRRTKGIKMEQMISELSYYLKGWGSYYSYCETPSVLRKQDQWIRRRLRSVYWKQWQNQRKRLRELRKRGVGGLEAIQTAASSKGPWRLSQTLAMSIAFPKSYFATLGLPTLAALQDA